LRMIWPYLEKYYGLDLEKYSARLITLSHDGTGFANRESRYRASESRDARASYCVLAQF
jgi:hypothetical protein